MDFEGFCGKALFGLHFGVYFEVPGLGGLFTGLDSMGGWIKELVSFIDGTWLIGLGLESALNFNGLFGGFGFGIEFGGRKSISKVHNINVFLL